MPDEDGRSSLVARVAALAALGIGIIVVAVVLLTGGNGYTYKIELQNAGQLVTGDDVQVGGRRVGSVKEIALTSDNRARITISLDKPYAPLHDGTAATVRATSLSGIANRYVALQLGRNDAPELPRDATLPEDRTTSIVDLDQIFNTLDAPTRRSLQQVVQGSATQFQGRGRQANQAARYFGPAISTTDSVVQELLRDQSTFTNFLIDSARVVQTIDDRRGDLANLVTNADRTAGAIGAENVSLGRALAVLPSTLRRGNSTFVNLRATLDDLDPLVSAAKPATKNLAPFLAKLRPLVRDARPTIADLRKIIRKPGPNNDLIDILRKTPKLARASSVAFPNAVAALKRAQPVVQFIRPYSPELVGWIRDFGQGASAYDANGHYARIAPQFNAFSFSDSPTGGVLNAIPPSSRAAGLQTGFIKRCPGGAGQKPADASAPFTDDGGLSPDDCDPSLVLPGP